MKELFQLYMDTEKRLCFLYKHAATMADISDEKEMMVQFSQSCDEAIKYLNYFYNEEFDETYNPVICEFDIKGTYRDILNNIQFLDLESFLRYRRHTYFQENILLRETMRSIADDKLTHILAILAIVIDMDDPKK